MNSGPDEVSVPRDPLSAATIRPMNRRTMVVGTAWSVPAIMLATATPAFAASSTLLNLSTPNMQVPAAGTVTITATLKRANGAPWAGQAVSFSGPSGATFSPSSSRTTNSSGIATVTMTLDDPWAAPGSTLVVNGVSGTQTKSQPFTVLGSNLLVAGKGNSATWAQTDREFPSPVSQAVASTDYGNDSTPFFAALLEDKTVWTKSDTAAWTKVSSLSSVEQVAAGDELRYYARLSDGSLKAWGYNGYGSLGDGTNTPRSTPTAVVGLTSGVAQVAAGPTFAYALMTDGSVRSWGQGEFAQLGNGTLTRSQLTPTPVSNVQGATQIAAGFRSGFALLSDGSVRAWGQNGSGQLGDGTNITRQTPVDVVGLPGAATDIAAGGGSAFALMQDGTVQAWGDNTYGQLGDGTTTSRSTPLAVPGLTGVSQIVANDKSVFAMLSDGTVWVWGRNNSGKLGVGSGANVLTPSPTGSVLGRSISALGSDVGTICYEALLIAAV